MEDDLITSPYFLKFMNEALEKYQDNERVMHIAGYMFPIRKEELPDTFFIKPTSCWGWATWNRAWKFFKRDPQNQINALTKKQIKDFNLNNTYDYWEQIVLNYEGKIYTWAIFWYLSVYLKGGLSLHPRNSLVKNIGTDASGTHIGKISVFDVELSMKDSWDFTDILEENILARQRLEEFFRSIKTPLWKRLAKKLLPQAIKNQLKADSKLLELIKRKDYI